MAAAGRPSAQQSLAVWMNGLLVGTWRVSRTGHEFIYDEDWLANSQARPMSLSMPLELGSEPFRGPRVESYFDNLLPDSREIRSRIAEHHGVSSKTFSLLEQIGRDCVGAVQLLQPGEEPQNVRRIDAVPLTEAKIESLLDRTLQGRPALLDDSDGELRISIAGAQEKTALLWHQGQWHLPRGSTPTTHILKLPLGKVGNAQADFSTSVENEWLCSKILHAYGVPVASTDMARFGQHKTLVVERFDRRYQEDGWWARIPQEDFCQVYGLPPEKKYQDKGGPDMDNILDTLRGSFQAIKDREDFLTRQLIFWLLAAPDGHAKNFSIFVSAGGSYQLTPSYDVISAWPVLGIGANRFDRKKLKLAMGVRGKNNHYRLDEIHRRHWNETAKRNRLGLDFEPVIKRIIETMPAVIARVERQLPPDFPSAVSTPVFEGMLEQVRKLERME